MNNSTDLFDLMHPAPDPMVVGAESATYSSLGARLMTLTPSTVTLLPCASAITAPIAESAACLKTSSALAKIDLSNCILSLLRLN